jgi:putative ABC transport system permease protein
LLLRRGSVLLAVLGAALVLAVTSAATPLFLSSVGSAALTRQLDRGCLNDSIPYVVSGQFGTIGGGFTLNGGDVSQVERSVFTAVHGVPNVDPTIETMIGSQLVELGAGKASPIEERVLSRTGFLDQVRMVERAPVRGVYITDDAARFLGGVHAGDKVTLALESRRTRVPVAGIYRNLEYQPPAQYWCAERSFIYPPGYGAEYTPPMVVLADHDVFRDLQRRLDNRAVLSFELPPTTYRMTVEQARAIDDAVTTSVAPQLTEGQQGEVFFGSFINVRPNLGHLITRSVATSRAVQDAVSPAAVAGALVALLLVAAAGSYWADRRRQEVRLLASRGAGPVAIGTKAALEMGPPALVGGAAGLAVAYLLVRAVGPSAVVDAAAVRFAALVTAAAVVAGVLLLGAAAAVRASRAGDVAHRRRAAGVAKWVPWELAALAAAALSLHRLVRHGATHLDVSGIATIDLLVLAFPLLFLCGAVGLAGRVAYVVLRSMRSRGRGGAVAFYLAGRRLASAPHVALVMLVAAALPIGTLVYSACVTRSVAATVHAKVSTYAGSDVATELVGNPPVPRPLAGQATKVARSEEQYLGTAVTGLEVDVLGVDPATFATGAYWVDSLAGGSSLRSLLDPLTNVRPHEPLPALFVGVPQGAPTELAQSNQGGIERVPLRVVRWLSAFPGERGRPLVVVDLRALQRVTADLRYGIWAKGSPDRVLGVFRQAGVTPLYVVDRDKVLDASSFLALSWTFGFLSVIAVLTGVIAIGGLLLYLESRTRVRVASYVLARRMGLGRAAHLGSLVTELGALLGVGLAVGCGLAYGAAWVVHGRLDVAPSLEPRPLMPVPVTALGSVAGTVVVVVMLGALAAQVSADRVRPAEVMRFDG